ncbi:MAG: uncharacterized protein K0S45_3739 [Nitrospira sp.]|nr:uncharacterized protein [Nitrospira sp.]
MQVYLQSVGITGPGLDGWAASRPILAGLAEHRMAPTSNTIPDILSAAERRRSSPAVRLALLAAQEALRAGNVRSEEMATVFASSDGDGDITQQICEALAGQAREVSPTSFHNSVHNVAAGYWSIATGSRLASTSLCAYDVSFAAGLLEAACFAVVEQQPVMLIASDLPFPSPLHTIRPVEQSFAAALLMTSTAGRAPLVRWQIGLDARSPATPFPAGLPGSLRSNPAARCLPLLATLAENRMDRITLDYSDSSSLMVTCETGCDR